MYEETVARNVAKQLKEKQNGSDGDVREEKRETASTENASDNKNSMLQAEVTTASAKQPSGNENSPQKTLVKHMEKENPAQSTKTEESQMDDEKEKLQTKIPSKIEIEKEGRDDQIKIPSEIEKLIVEFQKEGSDDKVTSDKFVMNIWDFGGQQIYHVMQRIFMVSFAVVCVVFNLCDDLDAQAKVLDPTTGNNYDHRMTNLEFILSWIQSIYTNSRPDAKINGQPCPPVLLIGTHLNGLKGTEEERKEQVKEIENKIWEALKDKPYETMVCSTIFTIENSVPFEQSNASAIMKQILDLSKKMIRTLPIKWLRVQQEIHSRKKHIYLPTSEIQDEVLKEVCKVTEGHKVLLEYLHDIGVILYYPDDEALRDIIVVDLMQLVDMFKTIITVIDNKDMVPAMRPAWRMLEKGILKGGLLKHLWEKICDSDETLTFFVSLMQKFGLVCEQKNTKNNEKMFYVLSRLKPHASQPPKFEEKRAISLFHDFGSYLPDDLFQRAATKFIEKFQMEDYGIGHLSYEHVELNIDANHQVILYVATIKHCRMLQTTIVRTKSFNTDKQKKRQRTKDEKPQPKVCKKVLRFLQTELKVFSQTGARGLEVRMYIPCACSPNIQNAHMHVIREFDKDVLPCGSNQMKVKLYRKLFGNKVIPRSTSQTDVESIPPQSHLQGYVDDSIIWKVSEETVNCEQLGVLLGLELSEVTTMKSPEEILKFWRNISSKLNQLDVLCEALREHGQKDLADKFQKNVVEERPKEKQIKLTELSRPDFNELITGVSNWCDTHGRGKCLNKMKMVISDFMNRPNCEMTLFDIQGAENTHELISLLILPGVIKCTDIRVLIQLIKLCGMGGVEEVIKPKWHVPKFEDVQIETFSDHRIKLLKFCKKVSFKNMKTIGRFYGISEVTDPYSLILRLEMEGYLTEGEKMNEFIEKLREYEMINEVNALTSLDN
ncbi:uncharacterized protein [Antedon mediterranea]|uniref:uncharacterized protein n=1 Tax=Antedon mediterranea TaxID=105859 RepID=UPI003AF64E0F